MIATTTLDPIRTMPRLLGRVCAAVIPACSSAAQVLVLLSVFRLWSGTLPLPLNSTGVILLLALVPAAMPVLLWEKLSRAGRCRGGIAPAAAQVLQPLAPLLGSMVVLCYWWGHCMLAAIGLAVASETLDSTLALSTGALSLKWPLALMILGLGTLPLPLRLRQAASLVLATIALASLGWMLSHGLGLPGLARNFATAPLDGDGFSLAGAFCACLFMVGPSVCAYEAVYALPYADAVGRMPRGALALIGTAAAAVLGMLACQLPAAVDVPQDGLSHWAPVLLLLSAGPLAMQLSQGAARRALRSLPLQGKQPLQTPAVPAATRSGSVWMSHLLTAGVILVFFVLREFPWLYAGAGLAYFVGLSGAAAVAFAPQLLRRSFGSAEPEAAVGRGVYAAVPVSYRVSIAASAATMIWMGAALLGLQAWGMQAVLTGLVMIYAGGMMHVGIRLFGQAPRAERTHASIHAKLLAGMLLILALNGVGYLVAHQALMGEDRSLAALIGDIFTAVALLTVSVGLVLPAMIVHALTRAAEAAEQLAHGTVTQLRECIDALGRGELDGESLHIDLHTLQTPFSDEIGRIASSINLLQVDVQRAAQGLESARDSLRRSRADLFQQARLDSLTGLDNRLSFEEKLTRAVAERRNAGFGHALLYLDLDQFKVVNDTSGHDAGDELLRQVSLLLAAQMRGNDTLSRLGGDEFGVILENCSQENAMRIADAMLVAVRELSFGWRDQVFRIGVSIGAVHFQGGATTLMEVMGAADKACYYAKEQGRNRVHFYSPDDAEIVMRSGEMQWVSRIHEAMEQGRLCLYAQQMLALQPEPGEGDHYELLLRMVDQDGELVPPMAFIPAAERFDVMPMIDRWVVRNALERLAELTRQGDADSIGSLAINLSRASITDESFLEYVKECFLLTQIPYDRIWFEITETAAMANLPKAIRFIAELRQLGCRFGLDDFGAGMSSFGYLRQLDVDFLKIDGIFVEDMLHDEIDSAMVESINRIGQLMGLRTVAEFVANEEASAKLGRMGVNMVQGNGIAPPVPFMMNQRAVVFPPRKVLQAAQLAVAGA